MIYKRLLIFEKILNFMRKSLLTVLLLLGVQALIAQNIAVAKLRSETSRSIKKDNKCCLFCESIKMIYTLVAYHVVLLSIAL